MVHFLKFVHVLKLLEMDAGYIKVDIPLVTLLQLLETVEFQRVYDTFVLRSCDFVEQLSLLKAEDSVCLLLLNAATLRVLEEDSRRTIGKNTPDEMHLSPFLEVLILLAVEVKAIVLVVLRTNAVL